MRWERQSRDVFFEVTSTADELIRERDTVGLTVVEEMDRMTTGNISLLDENHLYSRAFRRGREISCAWGYTFDPSKLMRGQDIQALATSRRGLRVVIQNPSGGASANGVVNYTVGFIAVYFRGEQMFTDYTNGTKATVVLEVFTRMGIVLMDIRFARGSDAVTEDNHVRQASSDFQFLARAAREWGAVFVTGYTAEGVPAAAFIDLEQTGASPVILAISNSPYNAAEFSYKDARNPNVLSYSWQIHEGESGRGAAMHIEYVNGQAIITRRVVEDERVVTWTLNTERIEAELTARAMEGGPSSEAALVKEILAAQDFEQVERFFDMVESSTAPQGVGYHVTMKVLGNVAITPGIAVLFKEGFPDFLTKPEAVQGLLRPLRFYVRKATHTVNAQGYFTDVEVADVFSESPTGLITTGGLI